MTAAQIVQILQDPGQRRLREALPDQFVLSDENLSRKLGTAFANQEGIRYGAEGYHVVRAGSVDRAIQWSVRTTDEADEEGRPSL